MHVASALTHEETLGDAGTRVDGKSLKLRAPLTRLSPASLAFPIPSFIIQSPSVLGPENQHVRLVWAVCSSKIPTGLYHSVQSVRAPRACGRGGKKRSYLRRSDVTAAVSPKQLFWLVTE